MTGGFQWEVPWTRWAPTVEAAEVSFLEAHPCPDCGGTGALIELPEGVKPLLVPTRRALRGVYSYSDHVASVLRNQARGKVSTS